VQETRARRKFALVILRKMTDVSIDDVQESELGLEGWSSITPTIGVGTGSGSAGTKAQAKNRAKAQCSAQGEAAAGVETTKATKTSTGDKAATGGKSTAGGKAGAGGSPLGKAEKAGKEIVAMVGRAEGQAAAIKSKSLEDPDSWSWATSKINDLDSEMAKLHAKLAEYQPFFSDFKLAALSQSDLRDLRKSVGDKYTYQLMALVENVKPLLDAVSSKTVQIQRMADAALGSSTAPGKQAKLQRT